MICQTQNMSQNMSQNIGGPKCETAKFLNFDPILLNELRLKINFKNILCYAFFGCEAF